MTVEYTVEIGHSYCRTTSSAIPGTYEPQSRPERVNRASPPVEDRIPATGISAKAQAELRRKVLSLPWERVSRLVFVSLTYPGSWERYCPDDVQLGRHRDCFVERWAYRWGRPVGLWVKEFQASGSPHLHMLVGLPEKVTAQEYEGLRAHTLLRLSLESRYGKYDGRARLPAIGGVAGEYGGMWAYELRTMWTDVVTGNAASRALAVRQHHTRGVNVRVATFGDDHPAAVSDWVRIADYLSKEVSKPSQKVASAKFGRVSRWYGVLHGEGGWFVPEVRAVVVTRDVWYRYRRVQRRYLKVVRGLRSRSGMAWAYRREQGVAVYGFSVAQSEQLLAWCERRADRRPLSRGRSVPVVDVETGEMLS